MAVERFTHIYISPKDGVTRAMIEKKMDLARDWFRYDNRVYIVLTTSEVEKWKMRLKPFVEPGGYLFICELDITKNTGWMTPEFWKWIKSHL